MRRKRLGRGRYRYLVGAEAYQIIKDEACRDRWLILIEIAGGLATDDNTPYVDGGYKRLYLAEEALFERVTERYGWAEIAEIVTRTEFDQLAVTMTLHANTLTKAITDVITEVLGHLRRGATVHAITKGLARAMGPPRRMARRSL